MTILIVLVVMGSSILLSFISYQRAKSSLVSQLEDNYAASAQKYALELTAWVSTNATIIDTLAAEIAVNGITFKGYDEFHSYLERSNELLNKNGYVYDVYFTYPDNYMVCASDFLADGTVDFVHEREWYTTSALTGELFFSTPYLDSDTLKPIITISKAVYKDGELLGVLAADIFVDVLVDMVSQVDVGVNSYAFLLDHNMHVITHPDSTYDYPDKPIGIMDAPDSPYQSLVDSIRSGADGMVFVDDYDGTVRGIVSAEMINTGWYVCLATDRKELEQSVASLMRGFVIAAGVAILIGVAMAVFLARVLDQLSSKEQEYRQENREGKVCFVYHHGRKNKCASKLTEEDRRERVAFLKAVQHEDSRVENTGQESEQVAQPLSGRDSFKKEAQDSCENDQDRDELNPCRLLSEN